MNATDTSVVKYGFRQYPVTEKSLVSLIASNVGKGKVQVARTMELTVLLRCRLIKKRGEIKGLRSYDSLIFYSIGIVCQLLCHSP